MVTYCIRVTGGVGECKRIMLQAYDHDPADIPTLFLCSLDIVSEARMASHLALATFPGQIAHGYCGCKD